MPAKVSSTTNPPRFGALAAWLAMLATGAAILLLATLHLLSPEFSPSWRVISEYAFGRYPWVLSLMFLSWGIGSWALAAAIWSEVRTGAGKVGLWLLILAGIGEAMASVFDITHEVGHGIAGLFGVIGFPIAAVLLSVALGHNENWRTVRPRLLWVANLSWISVVLLVGTLAVMTMQMARVNHGHLPQHAPKTLPPGVLALDGWADRMIVVSNCAWVLFAAWHAIKLAAGISTTDGSAGGRQGEPAFVEAGAAGTTAQLAVQVARRTLRDSLPRSAGRDRAVLRGVEVAGFDAEHQASAPSRMLQPASLDEPQ